MALPSGTRTYFNAANPAFLKQDYPQTVNPEDLLATTYSDTMVHSSREAISEDNSHLNTALLEDLEGSSNFNNNYYPHEMTTHDSGVDLRGQWRSEVKQPSTEPYEQFLNMGDSPLATNTPSPATDMIFSTSNSPGEFVRDHSSASSPDNAGPALKAETEMLDSSDMWTNSFPSQDAILVPKQKPMVHLTSDKTKTRAETQIKMTLTLDPLENIEYIRFPRKTLAKPKHFASEEEKHDIEAKGTVVHMDVHLVCATAVEAHCDRERAMRRAAGTEAIPRRPEGVAISELDKEDPSHPQNGGEVLICEGCKERERKRYDRKKKRGEDEEEFTKYENDRVIMINEKEHKKLKEAEGGEVQFSSRAKQVEFAMRIACYCRHQEEKSPQGYRVIFTFMQGKNLLVQHLSDVFHITDDHKNKEFSGEVIPQRLTIPPGYGMTPYNQASMLSYPYIDSFATGVNGYSQPPTPVLSSQYASPISPVDSAFSQSIPSSFSQPIPTPLAQPVAQPLSTLQQQARQPAPAFSSIASTNVSNFARHQRNQSYYDAPLLSPTAQFETHSIPRNQSLDNFSFMYGSHEPHFGQIQQYQYFNSAPPSAGGTPINLSRPASPTWEQGVYKKSKPFGSRGLHIKIES